MMALFSPMSLRSSRSSHILGYAMLTSSTSTVRSVNPARLIRLDMSRGSGQLVTGEYQLGVDVTRLPLAIHVGKFRLLFQLLRAEERYATQRECHLLRGRR